MAGESPSIGIDIRLFHLLQELARVGGERFEIAPLPFGVKRIEGERGFSRPGDAGDDDQLVARNFQIDVFEIVNPRALMTILPHRADSCHPARSGSELTSNFGFGSEDSLLKLYASMLRILSLSRSARDTL